LIQINDNTPQFVDTEYVIYICENIKNGVELAIIIPDPENPELCKTAESDLYELKATDLDISFEYGNPSIRFVC